MKTRTTSALLWAALLSASALTVAGCSFGGGGTPDHVVYSVAGQNDSDGVVIEGGGQWPEELPSIDGCQGATVTRSGEAIMAACTVPGSYADARAKVQAAITAAVSEISMETDTGDWYSCGGNLDEQTMLTGMVAPGSDGGNAIMIQRTPMDDAEMP